MEKHLKSIWAMNFSFTPLPGHHQITFLFLLHTSSWRNLRLFIFSSSPSWAAEFPVFLIDFLFIEHNSMSNVIMGRKNAEQLSFISWLSFDAWAIALKEKWMNCCQDDFTDIMRAVAAAKTKQHSGTFSTSSLYFRWQKDFASLLAFVILVSYPFANEKKLWFFVSWIVRNLCIPSAYDMVP